MDKKAIWRNVPEGAARIGEVGQRQYVRGSWEELGRLQFEYLLANGLQREHRLLDIGCGALRGALHFIKHRAPVNYLGIDKERRHLQLAFSDSRLEMEQVGEGAGWHASYTGYWGHPGDHKMIVYTAA